MPLHGSAVVKVIRATGTAATATRRRLLLAAGASAAIWPFGAGGQPKSGIPHIGYLSLGSEASNRAFLDALKDGLRELGYVDGRNIIIDVRWAGAAPDQLPGLAASLVSQQSTAIIGTCVTSTRAAKNATSTIPVVMALDGDPVAAKLIASFARPGGNVTGTSTLFEELIPKWVELLATAVPKMRTVAVIHNPFDLVDPFYAALAAEAGQRAGVTVTKFDAAFPEELSGAFAAASKQHAGGVVVLTEALFAGQVEPIVQLAAHHRLPAIYGFREFAIAGGLMSYGVSFRSYYKRVARYVDAVLKGTKPADLPVEQPTRIELVINMKTARALGLAIPQALVVRADEVIQ